MSNKSLGVTLIAISVIAPIISGDLTICAITIPLGIYTFITKEKIIWE